MTDQAVNPAVADEAQIPFSIQRIYVKDISFESPNAPAIFRKEWQPEVKLDLDTRSNKLDENLFEVVLTLTTTVSVENETAFLCEVHQAGIFTIPTVSEPQLAHMIASFCPNILFPYAREAVSSLVNRGTFAALNLAPVNFDALFAQYVQQQQQQAAEASGQLN